VKLVKRVAAEGVGTAFLLAIIIGSGIMGEQLAQGNLAIALLANTLATGAGLAVLILVFAPVSGAHLNPVVSLVEAVRGELAWRAVPAYISVQVAGAFLGVAIAHSMFGKPMFFASQHVREGVPQMFGEFVATFGLILVVLSVSKSRSSAIPFAVGAYITAAYWFTSSTSFANPAVTLARAASDTFAGIRPADAPGFILCQCLGALAAMGFAAWLNAKPDK
jgi:glycerol uptake facilitator-like aquaporin